MKITELRETEKNWAMFCHLTAFAGYFFPFGGIIGSSDLLVVEKR